MIFEMYNTAVKEILIRLESNPPFLEDSFIMLPCYGTFLSPKK